MKVCVFYRSHSDHARAVEDFVHEFKRFHGHRLELEDVETRSGADMASIYDIMQYPSILVLQDDGQLVQMWSGERLPLMNEVASYVAS